jgi:hypothetical protein
MGVILDAMGVAFVGRCPGARCGASARSGSSAPNGLDDEERVAHFAEDDTSLPRARSSGPVFGNDP